MTLKNNRAPLLTNIKLCASFHHHMWIQTGVTVRKRLSWVLTSVTITFDIWPWPFAWTSLLSMVITLKNFMMIRWWEQMTDKQTDRQTDWTIHRAAWSQLKILPLKFPNYGKPLNIKFWERGSDGKTFYCSMHSISQPPVHLCFARAIELIAHLKITKIPSFSWGFSAKVAFCTP